MSICGIDYSTHAIDVVLLDETTDAATWTRYELAGKDAFDRARSVKGAYMLEGAATFPGGVFWDEVLAVGIEDPRGYGAGSLYRVQGAILACLPPRTLVAPLIPSHWRKTVGLPGNASKKDVAWFVGHERHIHALDGKDTGTTTLPLWPQDACDAYCIALATRTLLQTAKEAA